MLTISAVMFLKCGQIDLVKIPGTDINFWQSFLFCDSKE